MMIRSQTEEMLWIAAQEDQIIPVDIIKFAAKKGVSITKIMEYAEEDFSEVDLRNIKKFFDKTEKIDEKKYLNIWNTIQSNKINMLFYDDYEFPDKLRQIPNNKSILLYHQGKNMPFEKCIAVVGTRNCSTYAAEFTRELSIQLGKEGYIIVAGLALGIDTVAHRGALSGGGNTIAVLPWMYNPTPKSNYRLLDEIKEHGFAVSDTFFNTQGMMAKARFVHRNEIISGISDLVVAVESGITGGTRHQVEIALNQNKTVVTLEPNQENKTAYEGFEKFVELGAIPVKSTKDVFNILNNKLFKKTIQKTTLLEFPSS